MSYTVELPHTDSEDFNIVVKKRKDIIADCNFHNTDEELICNSIIEHIEQTAHDIIVANKCANLPFIGNIRKSPVYLGIKQEKKKLHVLRKTMSKEEYQEYTSTKIQEIRDEYNEQDRIKTLFNKLKGKHRKQYDIYATKLGKHYADLYIYSLTWFEIVEFDEDFEEHYRLLNN